MPSKKDLVASLPAVLSAAGGFGVLFWLVWELTPIPGGSEAWATLAKLALAVLIAFAVTGLLRFALAPLAAKADASRATTQSDQDAIMRGRIAPIVLGIGGIAIGVLSLILIGAFLYAASDSAANNQIKPKLDSLLMGVFTAVLPVFATWVGTVLAFYFTNESFRQAAQSTQALLTRQASTGTVSDLMIPYDRIARLEVDPSNAENEPVADAISKMSEAAKRVIVFDKNKRTPLFVIRSASPPMPPGWIDGNYQPAGPAKEAPPGGKLATIRDYLDSPSPGANWADATNFSFIEASAKRDAALAKMGEKTTDDLFVTADGQPSGQVLGWLTRNELAATSPTR